MSIMSDYERKKEADRLAHQEYLRRSDELAQIIKPLRTARYEVDHDWRYMPTALKRFEEDFGVLEMNPDFQRGHVWTPEQQRHYIENVLRGVMSTSGLLIQFNCPSWDSDDYDGDLPKGVQCIDGLQRVTAVLEFLEGKVKPFGFTPDDLVGSKFSIKSNYRFRVAVHNFTWRADLLQHYLDLNAGGTPHSPEEIERVRALRESALATNKAGGVSGPSL